MPDQFNIEIKAHCSQHSEIRKILKTQRAEYKGLDHQIDTYFHTPRGRLKIRQGNIESALIFYFRPDLEGPKKSDYTLYKSEDLELLKAILEDALGIKTIVEKKREIYYIKNAKILLDQVNSLGEFLEIEIINRKTQNDPRFQSLQDQCEYYMKLFKVNQNELISKSYSDLMLEKE